MRSETFNRKGHGNIPKQEKKKSTLHVNQVGQMCSEEKTRNKKKDNENMIHINIT